MAEFPAHQVILIRPAKFGFNPETAASNAFQNSSVKDTDAAVVQEKALREFSELEYVLTNLGVDLLIFDDTPEPHTPDSIFPNNWFSTHPDGTLCLYPMLAENRRHERREEIIAALQEKFDIRRTLDLTGFENEGKFLEGTGSLVIDHKNRIAYACLSPRTDPALLDIWAREMDLLVVKFSAFDERGQAIYHTNVLMCIGDDFAIACLNSIGDAGERDNVTDSLMRSGKEIVEISLGQMKNFAGNMLLLCNKAGENILVMSRQALDSLNPAQVSSLSKYAALTPVEISTIESCGGGSVRCMIAENFLIPRP